MAYVLAAVIAQTNPPNYKAVSRGSYLFLATEGGIKAYTFNGTTFSFKDVKLTNEHVVSCSVDSTFLHVLSYTGSTPHVTSFTFDGSVLTQVNQITLTVDLVGFFDIYSDDTYVYYTYIYYTYEGLYKIKNSIRVLNKTTYTILDTYKVTIPLPLLPPSLPHYGVGGLSKIGSYLIGGFGYSKGTLDAYSFNGSTLSLLASSGIISNYNIEQVSCNSNYIFAIDNFNVYALSFNGTSFTLLGTYVTGDQNLNDLTCDDNGVYVTGDSHTFVLQFAGTFTLAQTIANTGRAISLMGAGTLVFSNSTNMYAYKS